MIGFSITGVLYYYGWDFRYGGNLAAVKWALPLIIFPSGALIAAFFFLRKALAPIIIVVNLLALAMIGLFYYYGFDLQWGLNRAAVTWGLPLIIALLVDLIALFLALKKQKWIWGIAGFAITILAIIYFHLLISTFSSVLLTGPALTPGNNPATEEGQILALFLAGSRHEDRYYTIVNPETALSGLESQKAEIKSYFGRYSPSFNILVDRLFELNQTPVRLGFKSSPQDGYYIDYEGKFARYLQEGGGGWQRLHQFRPRVSGFTTVSIPAFDAATGYVLELPVVQGDPRNMGVIFPGIIYAYQLVDGKLIKVGEPFLLD